MIVWIKGKQRKTKSQWKTKTEEQSHQKIITFRKKETPTTPPPPPVKKKHYIRDTSTHSRTLVCTHVHTHTHTHTELTFTDSHFLPYRFHINVILRKSTRRQDAKHQSLTKSELVCSHTHAHVKTGRNSLLHWLAMEAVGQKTQIILLSTLTSLWGWYILNTDDHRNQMLPWKCYIPLICDHSCVMEVVSACCGLPVIVCCYENGSSRCGGRQSTLSTCL